MSKIAAIQRLGRRRDPEAKAEAIQTVLCAPALRRPAAIEAASRSIRPPELVAGPEGCSA
jgi:hypothetical protein